MFAHKVIDDLNEFAKHSQNMDVLDFRINNVLIPNITIAEKFHYPSIEYLYEQQTETNSSVFMGEQAEYIRLPYEVCWLDCVVDGIYRDKQNSLQSDPLQMNYKEEAGRVTKIGALLQKHTLDSFTVDTFMYYNAKKIWMPGMNFYSVSIGKIWNNMPREVREALHIPHIKHTPETQENVYGWCLMPTNSMKESIDYAKYFAEEDRPMFLFIQAAILLLNCRNITTQTNKPHSKLNKKRIKTGRTPVFKYKTLVIKPTISGKSTTKSETTKAIPFHKVRGHFRVYSKDKPMFGRPGLYGRFFIPDHKRGKLENGMVLKEYLIK